ncbi:MFS transporter [Corynebacterium nasicanis]|uniref:MFS transporter n=1 Tax=Corynebacterium nasicanis TaxID=1448267 RepID=A0ABW1Q8Y6_9CORY
MWKAPGFIPTLVAVFAAFGAWSLLLPVVPLAALDAGHSATIAGATTGVFMATTVATQILTPAMLRRIGYNPVMVAAAFTLGVPALGHLLDDAVWALLLFSALRGIGFGALTVAESALIAELVPARFLGQASGMLGVFLGVAQMIGLPAGLWMVGRFGYDTVYVTAAVVALVAALMCLRIPRIRAQARPRGRAAGDVSMWKLVLVPALAVNTLAMSFGAVSSFLPAAVLELDPVAGAVIGGVMLSIIGGASMVLRYISGMVADRVGRAGLTMIPGQIMGFAGVALMALVLAQGWSVWWLVLAGVLFGGGFGMVQNEALLGMFQRLPRTKVSEASAVWNMAYDAGTGVGSVILGFVAARAAYSGAYTVAAAIVAVGILATVLDRVLGAHRVTEHNNIRTRLRQIPVPRRSTGKGP